ncbi:YceI family protein [Croceitalea rosinachiae]|uniref:YceI family protein n=1 Tax=Croceitalea rosinachiae TaxID=3075596 RepID=A0ABU3ACQ6_9FLAO|nr:YceI family protein [Croceitalea sp. F388]MDT0607769.1 YceI family protein [Croceitalea sp. F388]
MIRVLAIFFLIAGSTNLVEVDEKVIARQGKVSFFSYTSVEDIKAENNQVLSVIDLDQKKIAVSMLMNAFIFEKALMREHFNESYLESDIYPKAVFEGEIIDFDRTITGEQTRIIKGVFAMHGKSKELEIKSKIEKKDNKYIVSGVFETLVKDYDINIPPLLAGNIAKSISVEFRFEYEPYED